MCLSSDFWTNFSSSAPILTPAQKYHKEAILKIISGTDVKEPWLPVSMLGLDVPSGAQTRKLGSIKWIAHTRKKVSALYCFYYNFNVFIKLPLEYHSILNE